MSTPVVREEKARCSACNQDIKISIIYNVAVDAWIAYMKTVRCPKCGANYKKIML